MRGSVSLLLGVLVGVCPALGCVRLNEAHCANDAGDATCRERSPDRPICSVCFESGEADGCTAGPVPIACRAEPDAAGSSSTAMEEGSTLASGRSTGSSGAPSTTIAVDGDSSSDDGSPPDLPPRCGDGIAQPGESCDGDDINGVTCDELELGVGTPQCTEACQLDTSTCCRPDGVSCTSPDECCSGACMVVIAGLGLECVPP